MHRILAATAFALITFPATAQAQAQPLHGNAPAYAGPYEYDYGAYDLYNVYGEPRLYGGFDGEPGQDDWYYDHYDLGYRYDDWYVDYYLDANDTARLQAREELDDAEDLKGIDDEFLVDDEVDELREDDVDDRILLNDYRREIDWDAYDEPSLYEDEGLYDGYGFD